ncbi:hypothetical protein CK203_115636 [Vitis vinifera]|uniref:DUF4283 domain-containing protein n=1 Tax=Vitis vinifera TaxID=29760 RepID=A0A438CQX4_VITVI|nr:hypothetical protein CK203_115636 [Vitis vinifera]
MRNWKYNKLGDHTPFINVAISIKVEITRMKVEKFEVEKKSFQEELDWLTEHLKKVVELEASRGFIRKTKTHLMEICFNNRGCFMKITEIVTKRKPLILVVPEGVKGNGWEDLRKAIFSVQEYSDQAGGASKEMFGDTQMSKGIYRVVGHTQKWLQRMDIGMEFCCQLENGPELGVSLWVQQGELNGSKNRKTFSERKVCSPKEMVAKSLKFILKKWGRVTKVARESLKLADLSKVKLWVEMLPNVVLPALLEVEDGAWTFTVAVSVIGEVDEDDIVMSESTRSRTSC